MTYINAGFPPVKYCINNNNNNEDETNIIKNVRSYSNISKQNINIHQLLIKNKKKPIIEINNNNNNDIIEVTDNI